MCRGLSIVGILCACEGVDLLICCTGGSVVMGAAAGREVGLGTDVSGVAGVGGTAEFTGRGLDCFCC